MKKLIQKLFIPGLLMIVLVAFTGFTPRPKTFIIDTDASSATWIGRSVAGQHSGTVYISSGELLVNNGTVSTGTVQVDVNSLTVSSMNDLQLNAQLTNRLKSKDFFDTYNHPLAMFRLASVWHESEKTYTVNGSLTIKGKTQFVRFPAIISLDKKSLSVTARIVVDRTKFNIVSGSTDFFKDLGNTAIHNEFELSLNLIAKRK
jgi:polyisoprenoid-binding protein YceI